MSNDNHTPNKPSMKDWFDLLMKPICEDPNQRPDASAIIFSAPAETDGPHVWVAVGTTKGEETSWIYTFATFDEADAFVQKASAHEISIGWDTYPCGVESAADAFENFKTILENFKP